MQHTFLLAVKPCGAGEQYQNREDLQPACQHIPNQYQLRQGTEGAKIAAWANSLQARADIVEAGKDCCNICGGGETVQRNEQHTGNNNDHISGKISVGIGKDLLVCDLIVTADHLNFLRIQNLTDVAPQTFKDQQHSGDLDATAGGTSSGTGDHQHQQYPLGETGP